MLPYKPLVTEFNKSMQIITTKFTEHPTIDNWEIFLQESRIDFEEKFKKKFRNRGDTQITDFKSYKKLGDGMFGTVKAVVNKKTDHSYAMKILSKQKIVEKKQVDHTYNEKRILQSVEFPFLVNLKFFFMDKSHLYFIMPLAQRGELYKSLIKQKFFDVDTARFYGGQVVLALEYLHYLDLIYRDLKPENIVVFENGYIKLTDYGFCKQVLKGRTYSFCGTPEYMAPEIILQKGYGKAVDWWALGVLLYEMIIGRTPFHAANYREIYEKITTSSTVRFPKSMSPEARHLISNLIEPDLSRRYGNLRAGVRDIKSHPWFADTDWMALLNCRLSPPYVPKKVSNGISLHSIEIEDSSMYGHIIFKDFE